MLYDVYSLGPEDSPSDPVAVLLAGPQRGELILSPRMPDRGQMAQLMEPDGTYLLPVMVRVTVKITKKGLVLEGDEVHPGRGRKSPATYLPQRWLCKHPGEVVRISPDRLMKRAAQKAVQQKSATGFDPADDDDNATEGQTYGPLDDSIK